MKPKRPPTSGAVRVLTSYRVNPDNLERATALAEYLQISRSELVETAVVEFLERNAS